MTEEVYDKPIINVLDKGYVRLVDHMGSDLSVVNAARASFDKESMLIDGQLPKNDVGLIKYLIKHKHWSPFRHAVVTFEFKAPLLVARQHWKHVVASTFIDDQNGWNEISKRYVADNNEFYIIQDNEWRSAPDDKKQGSGPMLDKLTGIELTDMLMSNIDRNVYDYEQALIRGAAPEQARVFLNGYALYVKYRWTGSLQSVLNFLELRLGEDAQSEITDYATAVQHLTSPLFPVTMDAWNLDPQK